MNLLPKTHEEFGKSEYWNSFFKKRGEKAFEWYGEYLELCDQLHKYIKNKDKILVVGCGNSKLSMDLFDSGFKEITNIDISQVVIKQMLEMNQKSRPSMKFLQMNAMEMNFIDEEYSVVLDKGTLDALMTDDTDAVKETVSKYFSEICRVLRNGGRYVCISLLQEHIIKYLLEYFPQNNCMLRVTRCFEAEQKNSDSNLGNVTMPVFVVVATKFKLLPQQILEVCFGGDKMHRLKSSDEMLQSILSVQKAALVCNGLSRGSIAGFNEVSIDLFEPGKNSARYTVYVLDQPPARGNGKYAAFIVPQGREIEWLFSTVQGRKKLLATAKNNRLAIVTLHRDHDYVSWECVKTELAESIKNLAPQGLKEQIPYLSLASDVGKRETLFCGFSEISGDFRIEEIEGDDGKLFRRLIFLSNQAVVQSEALIQRTKNENSLKKKLDLSYLACDHHLYMTIGVNLSSKNSKTNSCDVLVVGLGGGGLCTFMHKVLKNVSITAIEIDPAMLEIAEEFFELKQDSRFKVVIDDGIEFLRKSSNNKQPKHFDAILFDVDSKDLSLGMNCPPKSFLESEILLAVKKLIDETGIFILNLVCRDELLRNEVVNNLKLFFKSICCYKLNEDVNEVIFCYNSSENSKSLNEWKNDFELSSKDLIKLVKKLKLSKNDIVVVSDFLKELTIS